MSDGALDASDGDPPAVVPGQDLVGPCDEGVDYVVELGQLAGFVEVTEPPEGLQGTGAVVGEAEAIEFLEGLPAGVETRVSLEEGVEAGPVCVGVGVASTQQQEPGTEHLGVEGGLDAVGLAVLDVSAHRGEPRREPSDGCGSGQAHGARGANRRPRRLCRLWTRL